MKNLILTIVSVLALNTINAQQDLVASVDTPIDISTEVATRNTIKSSSLGDDYFKTLKPFRESVIVRNLETEIANYNLKTKAIYDKSEPATYEVTFKNGLSKAHVNFNDKGEILKSIETYYNIRLPLGLQNKISEEYPDYFIGGNKVIIKYNYSADVKVLYKVKITKGKWHKTVKFNQHFTAI